MIPTEKQVHITPTSQTLTTTVLIPVFYRWMENENAVTQTMEPYWALHRGNTAICDISEPEGQDAGWIKPNSEGQEKTAWLHMYTWDIANNQTHKSR